MNGEKVGEGRIPHTQPIIFSADEIADVGIDLATPVVEEIGSEKNRGSRGTFPKSPSRCINQAATAVRRIAIVFFALVALTSGVFVSLNTPWMRIAVRVVGSWIFAGGLLMVGWLFRMV